MNDDEKKLVRTAIWYLRNSLSQPMGRVSLGNVERALSCLEELGVD